MGRRDLDDAIARCASRQMLLFTRAQALDAGADRSFARRRLDAGRWIRLTEQVCALPGFVRTPATLALASVLDTPGPAAAARTCAAGLLGFAGWWPDRPTRVVTANERAHRCELAIVHRSRYLPRHHITRVGVIPVTTPARTIFDLALTMPLRRITGIADTAWEMGLVAWPEMHEMLDELHVRGRPGIRNMKALLAERPADARRRTPAA